MRPGLLLASSLVLRCRHAERLPCRTTFARCCAAGAADGSSVSGVIYAAAADQPTVKLFTKAGCTLCDVAKEVLVRAAKEQPHTLVAVDITDEVHADWWARYKYDIPVLHVDDVYWAKHRISLEESLEALLAAREKRFDAMPGEPDARKSRPLSSKADCECDDA